MVRVVALDDRSVPDGGLEDDREMVGVVVVRDRTALEADLSRSGEASVFVFVHGGYRGAAALSLMLTKRRIPFLDFSDSSIRSVTRRRLRTKLRRLPDFLESLGIAARIDVQERVIEFVMDGTRLSSMARDVREISMGLRGVRLGQRDRCEVLPADRALLRARICRFMGRVAEDYAFFEVGQGRQGVVDVLSTIGPRGVPDGGFDELGEAPSVGALYERIFAENSWAACAAAAVGRTGTKGQLCAALKSRLELEADLWGQLEVICAGLDSLGEGTESEVEARVTKVGAALETLVARTWA